MGVYHDWKELSDAAIAADDRYGRALERVYGADAGDARYDRRGEATAELRDLAARKRRADDRLRTFGRKY